jgi:glycosyltransferase involved in cell wall biosynthesis
MTLPRRLTIDVARKLIDEQTESVVDNRLIQNPVISICLLTYNHQSYIQQALDSVAAQATQVPIEIVIGDDSSDDGTTQMVLQFQRNHPETVHVLLAKQNLGCHTGNGRLNLLRTLGACRGQYVALLEGDDYWIDSSKLQKQLNFLERHEDFVLCFHNARLLSTRSGHHFDRLMHEGLETDVFQTRDLLRQWFIPSASIFFRRYEGFEFPEWFLHVQSGDIALLLLISLRGSFKYLDEAMSVYRLHDKGLSTTHFGHRKAIGMAFLYQNFNIETRYEFDSEVTDAIVGEFNQHLPELQNRRTSDRSLSVLWLALTWPLRLLTKPFRDN